MSSSRWFLRLAIIMTAMVVAAGCTSGDQTAPPTTKLSSTTPRPTVAPPVARTLDLASYRTRPCDLLKPDQQAPFDLPPRTEQQLSDSCVWSKAQTKSALTVRLEIDVDFLAKTFTESNDQVYPGADRKKYEIFEPRTIAGQPAVIFSVTASRLLCDVVVATGPRDSIWIMRTSGLIEEDGCAKAVEFAEQMIRNLEG